MPITERSEKSNKRGNDQPHDPFANCFLIAGEIGRNEIYQNRSNYGKTIGKKVDDESNDEPFYDLLLLLHLKVIFIDSFNGSDTPSLCFCSFQTEAQL